MLTSCKPMRSEYRWEAPIRGFEKPSRNPSRSERHRGTAIWRHSPVLPGAKRRIERELKDAELQFFLCAVMTLFFVVSEKLMLVVQMELVLYLLEKSKEKCTSRHPASTGSPRVIRARSALKALVNISPPRAMYVSARMYPSLTRGAAVRSTQRLRICVTSDLYERITCVGYRKGNGSIFIRGRVALDRLARARAPSLDGP